MASTQHTRPTVPAESEVYVSYAWAREQQDPLVEALCNDLSKQGLRICRDSTELQPGDCISRYMERLSAGRCVVVVLSRDYLCSENCMTELYRLYTNVRQRKEDFQRHIVPLVQDDARIDTFKERSTHAKYWKAKYEEMNEEIREYGLEIHNVEDCHQGILIRDICHNVTRMLRYISQIWIPRDRPTLSKDNFALVKKLIERALA